MLFSPESLEEHELAVLRLDPTQRQVFDDVRSWADRVKAWSSDQAFLEVDTDPWRLVLLGTAGTGKTLTTQCAVTAARLAYGNCDAVATVAHTGAAASNMGGGAVTIDKLFKLSGDNADRDLQCDALRDVAELFFTVRLVVVDEISMVGAAQFEMINRRLQQIRSFIRQRLNASADVLDFGNFGLLLVGDFG